MVKCDALKITEARRQGMKYVCDAYGGKTWFRIENEDRATRSFQPSSRTLFEQEIGLATHIQRVMPLFLTLRDGEGNALVTAMLPPGGKERDRFSPIIVGVSNSDPNPEHGEAIRALGDHFGIK